MKDIDDSTSIDESRIRSAKFYYLAHKTKLYIQITDKISGHFVYSENNHLIK